MSLKYEPVLSTTWQIGKVGVRNVLSNADAHGNEDGKITKKELAGFLIDLKREREEAFKEASSKAMDMSGFMPGMQQMADLFSMMDGGNNPLLLETSSYKNAIDAVHNKYDAKIEALSQILLGATPKINDTDNIEIGSFLTPELGDDFLSLSDFGATANMGLKISDTGTTADNKWLALKAITNEGAEPKDNKMLKTILKLMGMPSQLLDMMNGNMDDVNPLELMQQLQGAKPTPSPLMGNPVAIPLIFMLSKDDSSSGSTSSSGNNDMMMMLMMTMAFQGMGKSSSSSAPAPSSGGGGLGGLGGLSGGLGGLGGLSGGAGGLGGLGGSSGGSLSSLLGGLNLGAGTLGLG